ncbi:MAG: M23 family metallopeptidase [Bacteroides sp.]|jgi:murein DD-endopeptidase MepM/ murein hydrolase activator NlpD|nr:M23 family metallopeptidase [Bacteroides sp.]
MPQKPEKKRSFFKKLHDKYRLVLMNDDTFEEKLSFRLTRFNVFIFFGALAIFLVVATTYLIAFTPLREYIPGYGDFNTRQVLRELTLRADSLETSLRQKDFYIENIRNIIEGREIVEEMPDTLDNPTFYGFEDLPHSPEDSILRAEMESMGQFGTSLTAMEILPEHNINQFYFFPPIKGVVTNYFDPASEHFGIDLVADPNEAIKATLDGTVIFAGWTIQTGYTVGIQHSNNLISVYKHNSVLLKQIGNTVKAGDVIAIIGNTGILSTGPHLHFELWSNGNPVDPLDYIIL